MTEWYDEQAVTIVPVHRRDYECLTSHSTAEHCIGEAIADEGHPSWEFAVHRRDVETGCQ